jgi:hypothetical protein
MKEFFLMLFFAKSILLTPGSVELSNHWTQIPLDEPLEAITSGAAIYLDVSTYVDAGLSIDKLDETFPAGTVEVRLVQKNGQEILLENSSAYSFEESKVYLSLGAADGVPTGKEFTRLYARSAKTLSGVSLAWRNHRK